MSSTKVTKHGLEELRPGRDALPGVPEGARRRGRGRESTAVGKAQFDSYYGRAVLKAPTWQARDIASYFFLGGLAGASSLVGLCAHVSGRRRLARVAKVGATLASGMSLAALVDDLGRPTRFINMLRVVKGTSPMNVGSWILAGYAPAATIAAFSEVTGTFAPLGTAATAASALLGAGLASYTGVLVADTAVPAWHDAYRELPFAFASSAAAAASGLGMVASGEGGSALRRLGVLGATGELVSVASLERRLDDVVARPYHEGLSGRLMAAAKVLNLIGGALCFLGRSRFVRALAGVSLLTGSVATRFGVFYAGVASSQDPAATVEPQRRRLLGAAADGAQQS